MRRDLYLVAAELRRLRDEEGLGLAGDGIRGIFVAQIELERLGLRPNETLSRTPAATSPKRTNRFMCPSVDVKE